MRELHILLRMTNFGDNEIWLNEKIRIWVTKKEKNVTINLRDGNKYLFWQFTWFNDWIYNNGYGKDKLKDMYKHQIANRYAKISIQPNNQDS